MPCLIRYIPVSRSNARPDAPPDRAADTLSAASRFEPPNGVYCVFATWHGLRVVCLTRHLDRLEDSAARAGFSLKLDRDHLREHLRGMIRDSGFNEVRIRISAAPGSPFLMVSIEPYDGPPEVLRRSGVHCATVPHAPRKNPEAKQTRWLLERAGLETGSADVYEQLLVDEAGRILEGASSNFYVVCADPDGEPGSMILQTADTGILPGISRAIVMNVAPEILKVRLEPPLISEREAFVESFLTSASRGVVPVVAIDDQPVGSGRPGPVTARLTESYDRKAEGMEEAL